MNCPPPIYPVQRAARVHLADAPPVVLRGEDGSSISGRLEVVSLNGGLLSLARPRQHGSVVKLMFVTDRGPVLALAELLPPLSWVHQPFRFLEFGQRAERALRAAIENWMGTARENEWIEQYRAAISKQGPPRTGRWKKVVAALGTSAAGAGALVYLLHHFR
jgi:hypothetical protein